MPLLWLGLVLFLGSAYFGAQQSQGWVLPLLKRLAPHATTGELNAVHVLLRKLSHMGEYAVLALLWLRGFLAARRVSLRRAAWAALLVCIACAFVDEAHQSMLPSRTGSALDVVLDSLGALLMLMLVRARHERVLPAPAVGPAAAAPDAGG
jgi:VanZ family protein